MNKISFYKSDKMNFEFDYILGQTLREKRLKNNMTMQEVADKLKTSRQLIFKYEKAEVSISKYVFLNYCKAIEENPYNVYDTTLFRLNKYINNNIEKILEV